MHSSAITAGKAQSGRPYRSTGQRRSSASGACSPPALVGRWHPSIRSTSLRGAARPRRGPPVHPARSPRAQRSAIMQATSGWSRWLWAAPTVVGFPHLLRLSPPARSKPGEDRRQNAGRVPDRRQIREFSVPLREPHPLSLAASRCSLSTKLLPADVTVMMVVDHDRPLRPRQRDRPGGDRAVRPQHPPPAVAPEHIHRPPPQPACTGARSSGSSRAAAAARTVLAQVDHRQALQVLTRDLLHRAQHPLRPKRRPR